MGINKSTAGNNTNLLEPNSSLMPQHVSTSLMPQHVSSHMPQHGSTSLMLQNVSTSLMPQHVSSSVAWGIRIQPTFALVRVVRGD